MKKIIFAAIAILLALIIVEGFFRLTQKPEKIQSPPSPIEFQQITRPVIKVVPEDHRAYVSMNFSDHLTTLSYPKSKTTFRVFVFGGSATRGLGFPHNGSFSGRLSGMLGAAFPNKRIEVVNLGAVGYSSNQVKELAKEVLKNGDPDLMVIYSGNNEYLDVKAKIATEKVDALGLLKSRKKLIDRFATARKIRSLLPEKKPQADPAMEILSTYLEIPMTESDHTFVINRFEQNLGAIADQCKAAGVPLVLSTLIACPVPNFEGYFIPRRERIDFDRMQLLYQAVGWARLGRWDRAKQVMGEISWVGPVLDLVRVNEAGGVRGLDRLPQQSRRALVDLAEQLIPEYEKSGDMGEPDKYALAICYRLTRREDQLQKLLETVTDYHRPAQKTDSLVSRFVFAQFLDSESYHQAFADLWRFDTRNNKAGPKINEAVRKVAGDKGVILADVEKNLGDWIEPSPWKYLLDYCHLNFEGNFQVADLIFKAAEKAGALPGKPARTDFYETLFLPDLEWLKEKGHDFRSRDKWLGFYFRVCYAYCRPPANQSDYEMYFQQDEKAGADLALVAVFKKNRDWYEKMF